MEPSTTAPPGQSTGSRTIADMMGLAAERFAGQVASRRKVEGTWKDTTYAEVGVVVSEVARGLIDLGLEPGERVAILCTTRPEWAYASFAVSSAGGVVVPIYPTNSAEECGYVAGDAEVRFVICEDAVQAAKIAAVRDELPALHEVVVIEPGGGPLTLDQVRARGRERDAAEVTARSGAVRPEDPYTFIYTSGTTGPPKGCVLSHGNYRSVLDMCRQLETLDPGDTVYLFLPLAHSYALLIQLLAVDLGASVAYFGGDTTQIVPELMEVRPHYMPAVPRIFEKLYTLVTSSGDPAKIRQATQLGLAVRDLQAAGKPVPDELQAPFEQAEAELFANVRNVFGGRLKQANTGAAPIAREILEFFYACGVPVLEGYGMTETSTVSTTQTIEQHRFGTVGRPLPGSEVRIAQDGEILLRGPHIFQGYHRREDASFGAIEDGWLHTGDLGSLDEDGYLTITGRKKDIIITAGGKNLTPANLENDLKQSRWISQAVMYGDRRPYPVALITLDPEEIARFASERDLPQDMAELAVHPEIHELVQGVVDEVNAKYARVEQIKRFVILDHDLSQETGELTPTLKVKRNVVNEKYAALFDELYAS